MAVMEKEPIPAEGAAEIAPGAGVWAWVMQRITAAVLILFLGAHFWVLHYAAAGEHIRLEAVIARLRSPFFMTVDYMLLATAIYHALNGVRMVVLDFGIGRRASSVFTIVLWIFGLVALVYGINTLEYLLTGKAFFYLRGG